MIGFIMINRRFIITVIIIILSQEDFMGRLVVDRIVNMLDISMNIYFDLFYNHFLLFGLLLPL